MPLSSVQAVTLTSFKRLEDAHSTNEVSSLNGKSVSSASIDKDATRLACRTEPQQTGGLKNKLLTGLSHLSEKVQSFFKNLLSGENKTEKTQSAATPQTPLSQEQVAKEYLKLGVEKGFTQLDTLAQISGSELKERHTELATGNGALRTVATGLRSIQQFGSAEHQMKASLIFDSDVTGIPFQQWATTGSTASELVQQSSADSLQNTAQALNDVAKSIAELTEEVRNFLSPNVDNSTASSLTNIDTKERKAENIEQEAGKGGGRSAKDSGRKTALDAISLLSTSVAPSKQVYLSSDTINNLQDAISSNEVNYHQLTNNTVSFGDLQTIRELALTITPPNSQLNEAGNLGSGINELSTSHPNIGNILTSIQTFIGESNQAWSELNASNPEQLLDAVARSTFNKQLISEQLSKMPVHAMQQAYEQLDGKFGERMRGIIDFAVEKVTLSDYTQDNPVMISTAVKYSTVIEGLMESLKLHLNQHLDHPIAQPTYISDSSQLSPLEQAALSRVGITKQIIEE